MVRSKLYSLIDVDEESAGSRLSRLFRDYSARFACNCGHTYEFIMFYECKFSLEKRSISEVGDLGNPSRAEYKLTLLREAKRA